MRELRTVHLRIRSCAFSLLCCIAFGAGCDSRQPLAPTPRGIARPALDAGESSIIGTAVVAPEQTSGVPLASVPESTWVVIRVSGQFDAEPNPVCTDQPPNWPCIFNAPASNFFDQRPFTNGPVQAWVVSTRTLQVPLRGTGGAVNTAGQAIGLYYGAASDELLIRSALQNFGTQNPNPVAQVESWLFSGAYSATATRISNPLTFTGGPSGDPQGTVSFTVGTTAPLQFINPPGVGGAGPNVDWYKVLFDDRDPFWQKQKTCHRLPLLNWVQAHEHLHRDLILKEIEKGIANTYSIEAQVYFKPLEEMRAFLRSEVIPGVQEYTNMSVGDRRHLLYPEQWNALPAEPGCHVSDILNPTPDS